MKSKRFIDLSIFGKAWRKFDPSLKLHWIYLWNNCDESGVYIIDDDLFEFENGFEFDLENFKKNFTEFIIISDDKILLKHFIEVNYGFVKEDYNPHKPLLRAISKNNLILNSSLNQACFKLEDEEEEECKDEEGGNNKKQIEKIDYKKIEEKFNSLNHSFPKISKINESRKSAIRARIKDFGIEKIETVFIKAANSDFLNGGGPNGFIASFDWLLNPSNFQKTLEGNYDNKKSTATPTFDTNREWPNYQP